MAELSYMEADTVSSYRLRKTFEASKTSYRLFMFFNLFRRTIGRGTGSSRKSLMQLRDEMFDAYGAPPNGTACRLAGDIKRLHTVNSFPEFLTNMGIEKMPYASNFTVFLRRSIEESVAKGYSIWSLSQEEALALRLKTEPLVRVRPSEEVKQEWEPKLRERGQSGFFPGKGR